MSLTAEQVAQIGPFVFEVLAKVKECIEKEKKIIAFYEPPVETHDEQCKNPVACRRAWRESWWNIVAREVLQPHELFAKSEWFNIEPVVKGLSVPGMHPRCRAAVVESALSGEGLKGYKVFINEGVEYFEREWLKSYGPENET